MSRRITRGDTAKRYRINFMKYPRVFADPSVKTIRRDIHGLIESTAGTETNLRNRQRRLAEAAKRGGGPPVKSGLLRGAEKVLREVTVGHYSPRSRGGVGSQASTGAQTARSNYGKKGQGSKSIMEWRMALAKEGLGTYADRPTELEPLKERTKGRRKITTSSGKSSVYSDPKPKIGPAPRVGPAAGYTGRLPGIAGFLAEPLALLGIAAIRDDIAVKDAWEYVKNMYNPQRQSGPSL